MSSSFITIGSTRIKKSNIKNFGISSRKRSSQGLIGGLKGLESGDGFWKGYFGERTVKYLYISTYQNDNYTFTEDEININESLKMLESI